MSNITIHPLLADCETIDCTNRATHEVKLDDAHHGYFCWKCTNKLLNKHHNVYHNKDRDTANDVCDNCDHARRSHSTELGFCVADKHRHSMGSGISCGCKQFVMCREPIKQTENA